MVLRPLLLQSPSLVFLFMHDAHVHSAFCICIVLVQSCYPCKGRSDQGITIVLCHSAYEVDSLLHIYPRSILRICRQSINVPQCIFHRISHSQLREYLLENVWSMYLEFGMHRSKRHSTPFAPSNAYGYSFQKICLHYVVTSTRVGKNLFSKNTESACETTAFQEIRAKRHTHK